jgi:cytoskeletal protein CcmA (bactofilin family)
MKTRVYLITAVFLIATGQPLFSQGSIYQTGDVVRIATTDTLYRQLIAAGEWVEIAGVIHNDIFAAASSVSIEGTIGDDAFVAGDNVSIKGTIGDMLVSAAGMFLLDGTVHGDLFTASRNIRFTENSRIHGNIYLAGEQINIDESSIVGGRSRIAAKTVTMDGRFDDHVTIYSNNVTFGAGYFSSGDTKIVSTKTVYRENLGVIPERLIIEVQRPPFFPVLMLQIWYYLGLLVIGFVLLFFFRPVAADLQRFAVERFWKNTGIGVLIFLLVPLALFLLLFPLITIPLSVIIGALYILILFVSYLMVALIIGLQFILWFKKEPQPATWYWALALGLILIAVLNNLPVLGPLFSLFLLFFGVGSFASYLVMRYRQRELSHA